MKKRIITLAFLGALLLIALVLLLFGGTRTDVYLLDFSANDDGTAMEIHIGVSGSAGYVRAVRTRASEDGLYLSFPSTFFLNTPVGARDTFTIDLPPDCRVIYIARDKGYEPTLEIDPIEGKWIRIR